MAGRFFCLVDFPYRVFSSRGFNEVGSFEYEDSIAYTLYLFLIYFS